MHHQEAHTLSKWRQLTERGGWGESAFSAQSVESSMPEKRTRLLPDFCFFFLSFTLEKRLISRVRVDLGLHEGVTEQ